MSEAAVLYDFCLWPYAPRVPLAGKRPFAELLQASFDLVAGGATLRAIADRCMQELGPQATVWGIKWDGRRLFWELYFYDYARLQRRVSVPRLKALFPQAAWSGIADVEHVPYFMFSLDLDDSGQWGPGVDVYVGTPGSEVSAGLCYACTEQGRAFKNIYYFFDAKRDRPHVLEKLSSSLHLPARPVPLGQLLWPQVSDCQTLVVANKRHNDGLYYSRVPVGQALWFMRRNACPEALCAYLERQQADFSHLLFDLGVDFHAEGGELTFFRSAIYGVV